MTRRKRTFICGWLALVLGYATPAIADTCESVNSAREAVRLSLDRDPPGYQYVDSAVSNAVLVAEGILKKEKMTEADRSAVKSSLDATQSVRAAREAASDTLMWLMDSGNTNVSVIVGLLSPTLGPAKDAVIATSISLTDAMYAAVCRDKSM